MEQKKIKLGVIGIGNMGSEHCRNLKAGKCPEIELVAVADLRKCRLDWARNTLGNVHCYTSGEELIQQDGCDAVLVSVPHYSHESLTIKALSNGKHVLCEKPASVTAESARRMMETADKTGNTLAYMFNQRTNCLYRGIKGLISSGEIGSIKRVNWIITDWYRTQRYYDSGSWRATWAGEGGGVLLNQCPHQLDLLIWLCGMPEKVRAVCHEGKWHNIEVEDDVSAYFEFPGGATGVLVVSTGDLPGTNRLEITGEKGKIVCEDEKVHCWLLHESERDICFHSNNPWYTENVRETVLSTDGLNPQHTGVLNAFAANLLHGDPLVAYPEDGLNAIMLSNAIYLSSWTGGNEICVPADEKIFNEMLTRKKENSKLKNCNDITYDTSHQGTGEIL